MDYSTCNRGVAMEFLVKIYPGTVIEDVGKTRALLDLVEADKVRIQNPAIYGRFSEIVQGANYSQREKQEIERVCEDFVREIAYKRGS